MIANTPIWLPQHSTDLADAFKSFQASFRRNPTYALGQVESDWLNALRDRAVRHREPYLVDCTERLLALFANPTGDADFKKMQRLCMKRP
jgi:hypothetical protein